MGRANKALRGAVAQLDAFLGGQPSALRAKPGARLQLSFDHVLCKLLIESASTPYFVQIGAFDGIENDPLHAYVKRGLLKGCLLEPQPDAFERLKRNYAGVDGLTFRRAAIAPRAGTTTLYRIRPGTPGPDWIFQLASFSREVVLKHAQWVPGLAQGIVSEEVETTTYDSIASQLPVEPSIVVIDTEGYDYEIIKLIEPARRRPRILLYEHLHLSRDDRNACLDLLMSVGYLVSIGEEDTIAYLPDSSEQTQPAADATRG